MTENRDELEVLTFDQAPAGEIIDVINSYVADWPYTRPVDAALLDNWPRRKQFQPENIWLARVGGRPAAFLHGEFRDDEALVHLLAVPKGGAATGEQLLRLYEAKARQAGLKKLLGPQWTAQAFYASYLIGHEPGHPHWATEANQSFAMADFDVKGANTFMVRDLSEPIAQPAPPDGYEIREMPGYGDELGAVSFSHRAFCGGQEVAHCYGRLFTYLPGPDGKPVGQFGHVGTDEAHRGKGLARLMVLAGLAKLRDMGAGEALIVTQQHNIPAMKSYRNCGFRQKHVLLSWVKPLA